jgi:hypothetical protein
MAYFILRWVMSLTNHENGVLQSMSEVLCQPNFLTRFSPMILLLHYQLALVVESG